MLLSTFTRLSLVIGLVLAVGLVVSVGCGSEAEPTAAPAPAPTAAPAPAPTAAPAPAPTAAPAPAPTAAMASFVPAGVKLAAPEEQVITLAWEEPLPSPDPQTLRTSPSYGVMYNLFEGLYKLDHNDQLEPAQAKSVDISEDGLTYTFHLHDDIKWSDGTAVTAHDFEWSWKRGIDPEVGAPQSWLYPGIQGVEAIEAGASPDTLGVKALDDLTFEVKLTKPRPDFLYVVALGYPMYPSPRHVVEKYGEKWTEAENIVGNGPFLMTKWDHDREIILEPNPLYHGESPVIQKVVMTIREQYRSPEALRAYEAGESNIVMVPAGEYRRVKEHPALSAQLVTEINFGGNVYALVDTTNPPFDDLRVRQAIYLGFDRTQITDEVLLGQYPPAYIWVPPGNIGRLPDEPVIPGGVAKAKELLAEAGFPNGEGMRELVLDVRGDLAPAGMKIFAEAMAKQLNDNLGINVRVTVTEDKAHFNKYGNGPIENEPFDMALIRWSQDFPDPSLQITGPLFGGGVYYGHRWEDKEFEARFFEADLNPDQKLRAEGIKREMKWLWENGMPVIPLVYWTENMLWRNVAGLHLYATGAVMKHMYVMAE